MKSCCQPRVARRRAPRDRGAIVVLGVLALVWGTQYLVIKRGQATLPPLLTVALRFAIVAVASQGVAWALRLRAPAGTLGARIVFGVAQAATMGALYWSEGHIASALAAIVVATEPFLVAAMAHRWVPGERLTWRTTAALAVGFAGLVLITVPGAADGTTERLAIAAVVAGSLAGAANKIVGKRLARQVPAPVMMRDMGVIVAIALGGASALLERDQPARFTAEAIAAIVYLGLVASTAASTTYFLLLRWFPVSALSYLQFVTALVAVLTGVVVGHEQLGGAVVLGAMAILGGLRLLARSPATAVEPTKGESAAA